MAGPVEISASPWERCPAASSTAGPEARISQIGIVGVEPKLLKLKVDSQENMKIILFILFYNYNNVCRADKTTECSYLLDCHLTRYLSGFMC